MKKLLLFLTGQLFKPVAKVVTYHYLYAYSGWEEKKIMLPNTNESGFLIDQNKRIKGSIKSIQTLNRFKFKKLREGLNNHIPNELKPNTAYYIYRNDRKGKTTRFNGIFYD